MEHKYGLFPYVNPYEPAIFYGCSNLAHFIDINFNHKTHGVLIWAGTDALTVARLGYNNFWNIQFRQNEHIKHIAKSPWIAEDLDSVGIPYFRLNITPGDNNDIKPEPPGNCIYMYNPWRETYTGGIYGLIKERLPYVFIEAKYTTYNREELLDIYKECFIGLRFTKHDGLSNTVCEMGLMGRRVVNNGDVPNCIHYKDDNIDGICDTVNNEHKYPLNYVKISEAVREYLDVGEDWLDTDYYL